MSSSLDVLYEALQRASNPANPPPPQPTALDTSSPASLPDPSLAGHEQSSSQLKPPNAAVESNHAQWQPSSTQQDDTPISQNQNIWPEGGSAKRDHSQIYSEVETEFRQRAMAFNGMPQMHNRNEYPNPPGAANNNPGEPSQSKASTVDNLFSDVDDNEMSDFDAMDQDDNMFEMLDLGQQAQNPTQPDSNTSLDTIPGIYQTPYHATIIETNDFADPGSHPSPTESQLVAEGFEFHNGLPEEVQINRFNDKAFRKALREIQSDLPRKQQWYAWSKAKQMLSSGPGSAATTEQMEKNWGEPLKRQDQDGYEHEREHQHEHHHEHQDEYEPKCQHQHEYHPEYSHEIGLPPTSHIAVSQLEDGIRGSPAQPISLSTTIHDRSGKEGEKDHKVGRHWIAQAPQAVASSSSASTRGFALGQGDWHASHEAHNHGDWASKLVQIDQDRLKQHPLGNLISKVTDEHRARRESKKKGAAYSAQATHPCHLTKASRQSSNASSIAAATVTAKKLDEIRAFRDKFCEADEEILAQMKASLKAKMLARRGGSAHGLLACPDNSSTDSHIQDPSAQDKEHKDHATTEHHLDPPQPSTTTIGPPLPSRPSALHLNSSTSIHSADLPRPQTNTILRRSPSSSPSLTRHLPPSLSPNRRSPSPWIDHPGINRPDTPRPSRPTSPLRTGRAGADIRQSVERSLSPFSDRNRDRESTPAYTQRSSSPSPASHLGTSSSTQHMPLPQHQAEDPRPIPHDTIMTDAPSPPRRTTQTSIRRLNPPSSPDPLFSPLHAGNTYNAPTTPYHHHQPPPPIPLSTPVLLLRPGKTRRKSLGGQIPSSTSSKPKSRNPTSVQGSNIQKPRNTTRKVTQVAQKVKKETKAAAAAAAKQTPGSKVAQAVKKIEEGIKGVVGEGSPPRRSGRLAGRKI